MTKPREKTREELQAGGPVKIYAQNCLQAPIDLRSTGNEGVARSRLQVLSGKALPLQASTTQALARAI